METPLDAASTTAGALFASSTFSVPQFQREYAWGRDEVREFLRDLAESLNSESYFLGLIIVTGAKREKDVVDGQQRILTLTLLATALVEFATEYERNALADRLRSTFLRSIDFATDEELPRVTLSDAADNHTLQAILSGEMPQIVPGDDSVSSALVEAFTEIRKLLVADLVQDPFKRLGVWADFLMNRLYFARFVHPDQGSAYRVFEVINTRGKELTTADLLKSYVLSQTLPTDRQHRYEEWQTVARAFSDQHPTVFVQFIRHAVTTARGHVQPRDLYDVLTGRDGSGKRSLAPTEFLDLLNRHLPAYLQMVDPTSDGPVSETELAAYVVLNEIKVVSVRPILLAMRDTRNPDAGAQELLRLVVRRVVVGSLGTGNVERRFGQAAMRIASDRAWEPALEALGDLNPTSSEFAQRVQHRSMNKNVLAVVRSSVIQHTITPNLIGHLYLIKPRDSEWSRNDEDRAAYWTSTIGNSFLATEPRRPMGSSTWQGFKSHLAPLHVDGEWLQEILSHPEWNIDAIEKVGQEMARLAVQVWYD